VIQLLTKNIYLDLTILNSEIQEINRNIAIKITKLALQKNPFPAVEWIAILNQIDAKTKAKTNYPVGSMQKNHLSQ
jgi:hypothetical protein